MLKQYMITVLGLIFMVTMVITLGMSTQGIGLKGTYDETSNTALVEDETISEESMLSDAVIIQSGMIWLSDTMADLNTESETMNVSAEETEAESTSETLVEQTADGETELAPAEILVETELLEDVQVEAETSYFDGYLLPVVDSYLNIRDTPTTDGTVVGKLYVDSQAKIIREDNGWYQIESGSVTGYVSKEFTITGAQAEQKALEAGKKICTVLESGLRVRKEPNMDADIYEVVAQNETFAVSNELDGWIEIKYTDDTFAYVSSDYVTVSFEMGNAVSIEEENAIRLAEQQTAQEIANLANTANDPNQPSSPAISDQITSSSAMTTIQRDSISATDEEIYLMACIVHMEAGAEPYEGQLAVANVILNRVRLGYGSTISEVIYAPGQFYGANSSALASRMAKGPNSSSMNATLEALSGVNNIGDYVFFLATRVANYSSYSEYTIIGNHCFYKR